MKLWGWLVASGDRDPGRIRGRVLAAPSPSEWIVVGSVLAIIVLSSRYEQFGLDWDVFAGAADGRMLSDRNLGYYYAYWLLPLFDLVDLAGPVAPLLWSVLDVAGVWFASRVFGARPPVVLAGFGALSSFFTGSITGIALAALAATWWALHARRWELAGIASLVAVAKPQWGVPLTVVALVSVRPRPIEWCRITAVPIAVAVASVVRWGFWPADIADLARQVPPEGNGSLWYFLGPVVVVMWAPIVLPMSALRRMQVVAATSLLAVPYVQQYDHTVVWVLAADGIGLFAYAYGPLHALIGWEATRAVLTVLPLSAWVWLVGDPVRAWWRRRVPGARGHGQPA